MYRLLIPGLAVCLVSACGEDLPAPPAPIVRPVRYVEVEGASAARSRTFSGIVKAGTESRLSFRVAGRILEVPVKVGDRVKQGGLIARLDNADFMLQVQDAQAALLRAKAQTRNARASYARVRALYENQNISRQELDSARAQAESAEASEASAAQNVQLLRRQLDYARLTAQSAGTISQVAVEAGEYVSPGAVVAVMQVGEQLNVEVSVPESLISRVEAGARVDVSVNALPDQRFEAVVTEVGVASAQSAVYPVVTRLEGETRDVRAGMAADVSFSFKKTHGPGVHVLPVSAVGEDRDGRFVFLVDRTEPGLGKVRRQAVAVGEMSSGGLDITEGLSEGDLVVTRGVGRIHPGLLVKLPGDAPRGDAEAGSEGAQGPNAVDGAPVKVTDAPPGAAPVEVRSPEPAAR